MKEKKSANKKQVLIAVLSVSLCFTATEVSGHFENNMQSVPSEEMFRVFNKISDKAYTNYTNIKSWQGKLDASIINIYQGNKAENVFNSTIDGEGQSPHTIIRHNETTVEFAADFENGFSYANKYHREPPRYIDKSNGDLLRSMSDDDYEISIGTPDYKITSRVSARRDGIISARTAIKEQRASQEDRATCNAGVYDPKAHLKTSLPVWEALPRLMQFIEIHGEFSVDGHYLRIEERKAEKLTEYFIEIPLKSPGGEYGGYLFQRMTFSSNVGFNITCYEERGFDGNLVRKETWDHEAIDGVYLPLKTTMEIYEDGKLVYQKVCTFVNQNVNQDIPEETFGYQNLGLENGDRFIDRIADKTFAYKNGELIEVAENN